MSAILVGLRHEPSSVPFRLYDADLRRSAGPGSIPLVARLARKGGPMQGTTYEERAARGARTQSLFRDVNERVREANDVFADVLLLGEWMCECADDECKARVEVSTAEYESVRASPIKFIVAPNDSHVFSEIEHVTKRTSRYWVVEKDGEAAELAARIDPRSHGLRGKTAAQRLFMPTNRRS
jgi:hypothetical protein